MHEQPQIKPKARDEDLLVEDLDGGVVVYDRRNNSAHWLDSAAAAVWRRSDGKLTASELAVQCGLSEQQVAEVLDRLDGIDLMVEPGVSRRTALRRIARVGGTAVVLAPVISSIAVPAALANSSQCAKIACSQAEKDCGAAAGTDAQSKTNAFCQAQSACRNTSTCANLTCGNSSHIWSGTCSF